MAKNIVFFIEWDTSSAYGVWVSDGTAAGTYEIGGLANAGIPGAGYKGGGFGYPTLAAFRSGVLFNGIDSSGGSSGLWFSDGTVQGTYEIGGLRDAGVSGVYKNGLQPDGFVVFGSKALFFGADPNYTGAIDGSNGGAGLWATDGTAAGTFELGGLQNAGVSGAYALGWEPRNFSAFGNKALFVATDTYDYRGLWITDGTTAGTVEIGGLKNGGIAGAASSGFGPAASPYFVTIGSEALFVAHDSAGYIASLWVTDGTAAGTQEIGGLGNAGLSGVGKLPSLGLNVRDLTGFGARALFEGSDASHPYGLWVTDGTLAGTYEIGGVNDAGVTNANSSGLQPSGITVIGNKAVFSGKDANGALSLWVTDGTAAGTVEIGGLGNAGLAGVGNGNALGPSSFAAIGNRVLFAGTDATGLRTLWVTDGTAAGTFEIGGLNNAGVAGAPKGGFFDTSFLASGNFAFFKAVDNPTHSGEGLWVSDGTVAGTHLVTNAASGANEANLNGAYGIVAGPAIRTATPGDFAGGGTSGILFRNSSNGETYLWTMSGANVASGAPTSTQVGNNWQIDGIGDFDGNGTADLMWVYNNAANAADPLNGVSYVSFQNGANATSGGVVQQLSSQWQVAGVGDFDGDGKSDVLYRNSSTGQTYVDIMNGPQVDWAASGFASQQVTNPNWAIAATADFNGDGKADILWRYNNAANASDPLNGALYEWQMNGTTVTNAGLLSQQPGSANWQVVGSGDFSGDGKVDVLFRYEDAANAANPLNGLTYIEFMNGATVTSGAPTQWQVDNGWVVAGIGDYYGTGTSDILWQQTSTGNTYLWDMNGANVTSGAYTSQQAGGGWAAQNGVSLHST